MHVEHKVQIEELNLILRYAVQCANLRPIEAAALEGLWNGEIGRVVAARLGVTQSAVQRAGMVAMQKMRLVLMRLGFESTQDLIGGGFDTRPAEPPEDAAVYIPKKGPRGERRSNKAALEAHAYRRGVRGDRDEREYVGVAL